MTPTPDLGPATVRWVGGLYAACVLLQRFAVPGLPVALILPLILLGTGWGLLRGLAEFNRARLAVWLFAAAATALAVAMQGFVLDRTYISLGSWGLFMVVWLPTTIQLVDRRRVTFIAVLRVVVAITAVLAAAAVTMTLTQYAGVPFRDWLADVVPDSMLLKNFATTYPVSYGSPIYRANAWIGLEPSMVSLQIGLGMIAALLIGARRSTIALLVVGLVVATSGSGVVLVVVALPIMLASSARKQLARYLVPAAVVMVLGASSPMGQSILNRVGEGSTRQSSLSLRGAYPYEYLWPTWAGDLSGIVFGWGPGSSQVLVEQSGILGLMVPTPVKVFFDYGLLAGGALAAMLLLSFAGGHSRALSVSLLVSLWTLQPGTTQMIVIMPVLLLVSWWSPREAALPLEGALGSDTRLSSAGRPLVAVNRRSYFP